MPDDDDEKGELVGMGLYNEPPEPEPEERAVLSGMLGKGLKLEETFTPSEEDDHDDGEEENKKSDQPTVSSFVVPSKHQRNQQLKMPDTNNMMSQQRSFFFDNNNNNDGSSSFQSLLSESQQLFNLGCTGYGYGGGWIWLRFCIA